MSKNSTIKTFTKSAWAKMETIATPTRTHGTIKRDEDGVAWEWNMANKRVTAKLVRK